MQVRLVVSRRQANHKVIVLKPETLVGRSAECNLRVASKEISRKHCRILIKDGVVSVRDLGSANGTFVNGYRLDADTDYTVAPDSELTVGGVDFLVQFTPPSDSAQENDQTIAEPKKGADSKTVAQIPDETVAEAPVIQVEEDWDSEELQEPPTLAETDSDAGIPIDDDFDEESLELDEEPRTEPGTDSDEFLADSEEPATIAEVPDDEFLADEDEEFTQFADDEEEDRLSVEDDSEQEHDNEEGDVTEDDITNFLNGMDDETEDSDESLGDFLKSID